jgi:hypothetical protein
MVTPVSGPTPLPPRADPAAISAPQPRGRELDPEAAAGHGDGAGAGEPAPGDRAIAWLQSSIHADYQEADEPTGEPLRSPTHYLGTT